MFRHTRAFWLFTAPCIVLFSVFFLLPLLLSIGFSFTNYDGWKKMDFVGFGNYAMIFRDSNFYGALGRTFLYTLFSLPFKVVVPLLVAALVIAPGLKLRGLARTMVYIPVLLSALVVGITINWMFSQEYGLVNFLIIRLGSRPLEWALNPALATFVISFASNWASLGFYMIIFIGGLTNISPELYEAAKIDGAGGFHAFLRITLPLLRPTTFLVMLLSTINLLKEYALVQGVTQGGPGLRTTYIIQYIFDKGFTQLQYGTASAISFVVMIIFALIAFAQFQINKGGEVAG
jgi:alpha-1,4-digalacturonate transport system permease protein